VIFRKLKKILKKKIQLISNQVVRDARPIWLGRWSLSEPSLIICSNQTAIQSKRVGNFWHSLRTLHKLNMILTCYGWRVWPRWIKWVGLWLTYIIFIYMPWLGLISTQDIRANNFLYGSQTQYEISGLWLMNLTLLIKWIELVKFALT
jgi:hypothetical protein